MNATISLEQILYSAAILAVMALGGFYQAWIYRGKDDKGPEMTGRTTVRSCRVGRGRAPTTGSHWDYLVTFALSDEWEIELYATESDYRTLKEDLSGTLTWKGKRFYHFDPDT